MKASEHSDPARAAHRSERFDVVVAGGGPAGLAAAISAAALGARTLLVERSHLLGGNAANAFVHTICGLYLADKPEPQAAHPGFPARFAATLHAAGGAGEPEQAGRVWVLPTDPIRFAGVAERACDEAKNLVVKRSCTVRNVHLGTEAAPHVLELGSPDPPPVFVRSDLLIDTTGDATAGALGGATTQSPSAAELQLPSFIFRLSGVETETLRGFGRLQLTHAVAGAVRTGDLPAGCESVLVRPGTQPGDAYVTLNLPRPTDTPYTPLDAERVSALEGIARDRAQRVAAFLRATRPAFANSRVATWPKRLGIRESRTLAGCETVTHEDVIRARRRDDEVALSTWPIELWQDHRRAHFEYPDGASSVPLGALVSRSHPRLGAAGRCLSATHEALGALRVIGTAFATGEALGVAAGLAANAGGGFDGVAPSDVRDHILAEAEPA